jgi:hypothetical protein
MVMLYPILMSDHTSKTFIRVKLGTKFAKKKSANFLHLRGRQTLTQGNKNKRMASIYSQKPPGLSKTAAGGGGGGGGGGGEGGYQQQGRGKKRGGDVGRRYSNIVGRTSNKNYK